ncbi:hypothetical protein FKM82_017826 [Ascaphus truei]
MLDGNLRETSLCQQTAALLWKNVLVKWRRKWHSALEWLQDLAFVFLVFIVTTIEYEPGHVKDSPALMLGRLDEFNKTNFTVGYVPTTHTAFYIMQKVANGNIIPDLNVREYATEEALLGDIKKRNLTAGVVFTDNFTYHIRYSIRDITDPNDYIAYMGLRISVRVADTAMLCFLRLLRRFRVLLSHPLLERGIPLPPSQH